MPPRAPRLFSRARAIQAARRLAVEALHRLAREAERLSLAFEPTLEPLPLRETPLGPLPEVRRRAPRAPEPEPRRRRTPSGNRGHAAELDVSPPTHASPVASADAPPTDAGPRPPARSPAPSAPASSPEPDAPRAAAFGPPPGLLAVQHLRVRLEGRIAALREGVQWARADDPSDALRRVRIASRRLRAFASLFAPMLGAKRAKTIGRDLRTVTRAIGPVREWDELLVRLRAEHEAADPLARAALEHVMARATRQRAKALSKTQHALGKLDLAALADAVDDELDRVCGRLLRADGPLPELQWELLGPVLERVFADLPTPDRDEQVEPLHEVRTRAKRLRYALELLRPALGDAYGPLRRPTKAIQRALGTHHEQALLAELLASRARELTDEGLITLGGALASVAERVVERRRRAYVLARPELSLFSRERYFELAGPALARPPEAPPRAPTDP